MAIAEHIRVQAVAEYTSGTWIGETASWGFSLIKRPGGVFPPVVNQPLPTFNAQAEAKQIDLPLFVVDRAWRSAEIEDTELDSAVEAFHAFNLSRKSYWSQYLNLNQYRVSAIQADGKVVNGATVYYTKAQNLGGEVTMATGPTGAQCISIRTGGRGPRNRGRMYVPYHRSMSGATGLITPAHVTSAATDAETLFRALAALVSVEPVVVSRTHRTYSEITAVGSGDEIDGQRRRRKGRKESYTMEQI